MTAQWMELPELGKEESGGLPRAVEQKHSEGWGVEKQ